VMEHFAAKEPEYFVEGHRVTSSQMWKVCWNKGRLYWKIAKLFHSVTLKSWSAQKPVNPTTYPAVTILSSCHKDKIFCISISLPSVSLWRSNSFLHSAIFISTGFWSCHELSSPQNESTYIQSKFWLYDTIIWKCFMVLQFPPHVKT
jgi:hypothetical protein